MTKDASAIFRTKALEKLRSPEQLNYLLTVTSPRSWLVLASLSALLAVFIVWGFVGRVQTTVAGRGALHLAAGNTAEAVIFVPIEEGHRIRTGMTVQLAPLSSREQTNGFVLGRVASVGAAPATHDSMLNAVGNDTLVQSLASAGNVIEVRIPLETDPNTPGAYRWTVQHPNPIELRNGAVINGQVIVSQQRPIEFALPFLGRFF